MNRKHYILRWLESIVKETEEKELDVEQILALARWQRERCI